MLLTAAYRKEIIRQQMFKVIILYIRSSAAPPKIIPPLWDPYFLKFLELLFIFGKATLKSFFDWEPLLPVGWLGTPE